jgi:uncharacterized protein (DUF1684 family)
MKTLLIGLGLFFMALAAEGQTYDDTIALFRKKYIEELLAEKRAPIKGAQVDRISFFKANKQYRLWAEFRETPGSTPFMIPTHSGKQKPYRQYGTLSFRIQGTEYVLHAYQGMDLLKDTTYKDYLFIPFRDRTNYESTYGGGRYIDLSIKDIVDGKVLLDFNKCYNPYCAYSDGFNCPIPPDENTLQIEIPAGEKAFTH